MNTSHTPIVISAGSEMSLDKRNDCFTTDDLKLYVETTPTQSGTRVRITIELTNDLQLDFIGIDLGPFEMKDDDKFLVEIPGFLENSGVISVDDAKRKELASSFVSVLHQSEGKSHLAGIGSIGDNSSVFSLVNNCIRAGYRLNKIIPAGRYYHTLYTSTGSDPLTLLEEYGKFIASLTKSTFERPTGWNSWDFYGAAISMEDLRKEMSSTKSLRHCDSIQYMTLDMGWEEAWGDWIPNRKFPDTFRKISSTIIQAGFKPGIWVAPLQVSLFTQLARHRQNLFLRDKNGSLIIEDKVSPVGPVLLLDFTLREVRDLVGGWFATMRKSGFELYKIDYLYNHFLTLQEDSLNGIAKVAFTRLVYQTIRQAVGPDAHIVNCGGNKEGAIGLVDSSRVSMDIHNFWGHIKNNARQIANSFWLNHNAWINDPDFAIARYAGNTDADYLNMPYSVKPFNQDTDFWMAGPEATPDEIRTWLSLVRLTGGALFLSDSIHALNQAGRDVLDKLFPPLNSPAIPLDLFKNKYPSFWLSSDTKHPTLGIFNWSDSPQTFTRPSEVKSSTGKEFWTDKVINLTESLTIQPHCSLLLELMA